MHPEPLTVEQLDLLREHAQPRIDGRWVFESSPWAYTAYDALAAIEACQLLDVPVSDVVSPEVWLRLVRRLVALEREVARIVPERAAVVPARAVPVAGGGRPAVGGGGA